MFTRTVCRVPREDEWGRPALHLPGARESHAWPAGPPNPGSPGRPQQVLASLAHALRTGDAHQAGSGKGRLLPAHAGNCRAERRTCGESTRSHPRAGGECGTFSALGRWVNGARARPRNAKLG